MIMHPVDIANEIKKYPVFSKWDDHLLLQVATLVRCKSVTRGEVILKEGQSNQQLFFLRSGQVGVYFNGEVVNQLTSPGEVMGEMSVLTKSEATGTIIALSEGELFVINNPDFQHIYPVEQRERVEFLFYKIFTGILVGRLVKANEKVRLFEILNRELVSAQDALGSLQAHKRVFLLESDVKQIAVTKSAVLGAGLEIDAHTVEAAGIAVMEKNLFDLFVVEESFPVFIESLRQTHPKAQLLVFSAQDVLENIRFLENADFIQYFVSKDALDRNASIHNILVSLKKIFSKDFFGLEKYLAWGAQVQEVVVTGSIQRHDARNQMLASLKEKGIRSSILSQVSVVSEEMLMNAIYDAPVDKNGNHIFNNLQRVENVQLKPEESSKLRFATDGVTLAISCLDPFGSLEKHVVLKYLKSCYENTQNPLGEKKGGAGRGLHQIVENSNLTVFNVKSQCKTEVISFFYLDPQRRSVKPSFHFFFV